MTEIFFNYKKLNYTAKLDIGGKIIELPMLQGTDGPLVVDITSLNTHDIFTIDPGFTSTASCMSGITYIDGDQGILRHRGYDIKELAQKSNFIELCYLLLNGELPKKDEYNMFVNEIKNFSTMHEKMQLMYKGFPRNAHPMAIMASAVNLLAAFHHEYIDINNAENRMKIAIKIIANIPILAAMAYKHTIGQPFVSPNNEFDYVSNFAYMMFSNPNEAYKTSPVINKALDILFMLHADHEQNASTSTVRLAGSSGADPFSVMGAGIAALWGPAHGGANEAVINMLEEIGTIERIPTYIARAKDKNDHFRLMGFGHRVYKNYDPRASVIKGICHEVLHELHKDNDPLLNIAVELEKIALKDEYFIEKKLYPNVDFYSGIIYRAMGIPTEMFTSMFAVARATGWIAQWKEMIDSGAMKIGRPRQLYVGKDVRGYTDIKNRN